MKKDRFVVKSSKTESVVWTVEDNMSGIGITFVEGDLFDTCRYFVIDKAKCKNKNIDGIVANITKWIGENHLDLAVCNVSARFRAIWLLNDSHCLTEGKKRQYVIPDDVHEWIMSHGGSKYIADTFRAIKTTTLQAQEDSSL